MAGRLPSSFGSYAQNHRIKWPEFRTWQINNVTLVAIKLESDSDLHLRLRGPGGSVMIAEIPAPGCVSSAVPVGHGHQERPVRGHEPVLGEFLLLALRLQERQHPSAGLLR